MIKGAAGMAVGLMGSLGQTAAVAHDGPEPEEFVDVDPTGPLTVKQSLLLAGTHLLGVLNPEDDYLPYWQLTCTPQYEAHYHRWWPAHNLGRWLDAMYRLQAAIGFEIPKRIDQAMLKNARRFFDNPDHISLNPDKWPVSPFTYDEGLQWDLHSIREGMLALNALARWRESDWAADMGVKMIRSLDAKLKTDGSWDLDAFDACQKRGKGVIHNVDSCDTHGRMIEALLWFYESTGELEALRFADRLAEYHLEHTVGKDGAIPPGAKADHTHSYFGTLRGLLLYGRLTKQREYVDRVAAHYPKNVRRVVHESGYTSHNMVVESFGETTSPGDAAQIALWLAQDGVGDYLDDVDRIVRSRLLPSQIRATPPLKAPKDGKDAHRALEKRMIGGYGGCHNHPHAAKLAVTDVTAADVHSLVDLYRHIARVENGVTEVLLHLDYEDSKVRVACDRSSPKGRLTVTPKSASRVALRVPRWAPNATLRVWIGGAEGEATISAGFARTGRIMAGTPVTMEYDLPVKTTRETGLGQEFEIFWRGDEVTGIRPNSDFYPFYPSA